MKIKMHIFLSLPLDECEYSPSHSLLYSQRRSLWEIFVQSNTDHVNTHMYLVEIIWVCSLGKQAKASFQVGCTNT